MKRILRIALLSIALFALGASSHRAAPDAMLRVDLIPHIV